MLRREGGHPVGAREHDSVERTRRRRLAGGTDLKDRGDQGRMAASGQRRPCARPPVPAVPPTRASPSALQAETDPVARLRAGGEEALRIPIGQFAVEPAQSA